MDTQCHSEIEDRILLALQCEQAGDIAGALRLAEGALDAARAGTHPVEWARALAAVARYRFRLGQYETARQLANEALALTDPAHRAQAAVHTEALLLLGMIASESNSLAACENYYRRAGDLAREIGDMLLFQRALHNLGSAVYLMRGQFDLAITADIQALQICHENDYIDWAMFPLITLAIAYQITNQRARAHETLAELRRQAQSGSAGEGYACYVEGMLALDEDNFQEAEKQLWRARSLAELLGDPSLNLDVRLGISRMYRVQGDAANAFAWSDDALQFSHRVGYRIYQGRSRVERGRASWMNDSTDAAETDLRSALELFTEMEMRCDLAETHLLLAALLRQRKDQHAAPVFYQAATAIQAGGYAFILDRERSLVHFLVAAYLNDPNPDLMRAGAALLERIERLPPRPLRVRTLGGLAVWVGARPVEAKSLRQRRAGELLALLLSSPGYSLSSAQVTEAMCPEKDIQSALDFYHHGISALRRLLEPDLPDRRFACRYLEANDERITLLAPAGSQIDFQDYEHYLQDKDWQKAVALYAGEFLPEFRYAEWTIPRRQHFADHFELALLALAESRLADREPAACLSLVRQVLLQNPWQEHAVELGMQAAVDLDDRITAIRLYQRLEKTLEKDLGIAPQAELQQLFAATRQRPTTKK